MMRKSFKVKGMLLALLGLATINSSQAHDEWSNGKKVPDWVKASCCGQADAHHLRPDQVTRSDDYYYVEGYNDRIPISQALPSQDGDYWIFYRDEGNVCSPEGGCSHSGQSAVWCFFAPMDF